MSDFAITRVDEQIPDDKTWAASREGFNTAGSGTLDVTAFDAETHYPNGYVPSGTPVSKSDSGLYVPLSGGEGGVTEYDAIVLEPVQIRDGQTVATFAALDHAIVYADRLRGSVEGATPAAHTGIQTR